MEANDDLRQPEVSMNTNAKIRGCGIHHVALQTADYPGTVAFYTEVLGCSLVHAWKSGDRELGLLDLGDGSHIEVIGVPAGTPAPDNASSFPILHLALRVDSVDEAIQLVRDAGYPVTLDPTDFDLGGMRIRIAFFQGPNREVLEFFETLSG
jgi:glyoxylase I family protein